MSLNLRKKWTILFYANGNNELEPEMRYAMKEIEHSGEVRNVHVALQIGRASHDLVKIVRPQTWRPDPDEDWEGVRRYILEENHLKFVCNLDKINMAHPNTLMDFVIWGITLFPADKYMLVVGGHSWQFLGTMTDYTQEKPYIMGIPGLVEAVNAAGRQVGAQFDLLIFDTCNFNVIEVLYELGAEPCHAAKHMLTYIGSGPICGLSYKTIVRRSDTLSHVPDTTGFIKNFIKDLGYNLVACQINHEQLCCIKELFSRLAIEYCYSNLDGDINFQHLLDYGNDLNPWHMRLMEIKEKISALVIGFTNQGDGQGLINVANRRTGDLDKIRLYSLLSFAKHNYWTYLLSEKSLRGIELSTNSSPPFHPLTLSENEIHRYISLMNPSFSESRIKEAVDSLARYKNEL